MQNYLHSDVAPCNRLTPVDVLCLSRAKRGMHPYGERKRETPLFLLGQRGLGGLLSLEMEGKSGSKRRRGGEDTTSMQEGPSAAQHTSHLHRTQVLSGYTGDTFLANFSLPTPLGRGA